MAIAVSIGAVADPHHSNEAVTTKPIMIFFNKLPRVKATTIATRKGTTAKSANGNTRFPGNTKANAIVSGIMINAVVITSGLPTTTAASNPINKRVPLNFFCDHFCAASEIGINPSINNEVILGIKTKTADMLTPNCLKS